MSVTLGDIRAAQRRIADGVIVSPCPESIPLSEITGARVFCKLENFQRTGSFKERGARNALKLLSAGARRRGVIAASAGNHALGLAYHGRLLGIPVTVVMPDYAPLIKIVTCEKLGARVLIKGADFGQARQEADRLGQAEGLTYVHGFDAPEIIAGQGTLGLEILRQVPDVDAIVCPIGGGGLIAGLSLAVKSVRPQVRIVGVESTATGNFSAALRRGRPAAVPRRPTLADGLATLTLGANAFALARTRVDEIVRVSEDWIALAILRMLELEKTVVEGAAAVPLAAMMAGHLPHLRGCKVVLVVGGGNIDPAILSRVIEMGLVHDGRLTRFSVKISDRPGGLAELARVIAAAGASIQDVAHDRAFSGPDGARPAWSARWRRAAASISRRCDEPCAARASIPNNEVHSRMRRSAGGFERFDCTPPGITVNFRRMILRGLISMTLRFFPGGAAAGDGRGTRTPPGIRARRGAALFCLRTIGWLGMSWLCIPAGQATTLDIPVFAGGYGTAFYEETARQFEALRPGVKVNIYGDPRISDKLRVRMIDGNLPDAALPRDLLIPALAHAGKLRDLTPLLDGPNWEGDARWRDTFLPGALDSWIVDGRRYGLPLSYACWTIFYNRALFRAHHWVPARTWDEFFELCEKIKAAGIAPISTTGIYSAYPDAFLRAAYHNLAGPVGWKALNDLAPGSYQDPRFERAAAVLQRVMQDYTLRGWEGATHTAAQIALLEGRAAMTISGSWMLNEMGDKIPPTFELGVCNFPIFPEGIADPTTIQAGADSFFLFATGDPVRERLSVDFLRFLTSRTRAAAFVRSADSPVAIKGVPLEAYSPRMRETAELISRARDAFNMPQRMQQAPAIRQALVDGRSQLMTGKISPREFARRVESAAASDRERVASPEAINYRHPLAGTALLLGLAGIAMWMAWRKIGFQRRDGKSRSGSTGEAYFARLRPSVGAVFIGPSLLLYAAVVVGPALAALMWAFTRWDGLGTQTYTGLFNFKWLLFESDLFWSALKNNCFLMVVPAAIVLPLALLFAYLLHRGVWGGNFFRAVFLFPNLLGGIAATLLWLGAYESHGGLINAALVALGNLLNSDWLRGFDGYPWLAQSHLYVALIPIYLWMACGFNLVLYLAAMEGIDGQLYEAAEIDGAPAWRQFFLITLPLIWEVVVISIVFLVIAGLNAFELIWLLTSQDPDSSTHTLGTLMVTSMFKEFAIGRATAIAVVLFVLIFAASAALLRGLKREAVE
jgi:threonine ammonia-lyase medium form